MALAVVHHRRERIHRISSAITGRSCHVERMGWTSYNPFVLGREHGLSSMSVFEPTRGFSLLIIKLFILDTFGRNAKPFSHRGLLPRWPHPLATPAGHTHWPHPPVITLGAIISCSLSFRPPTRCSLFHMVEDKCSYCQHECLVFFLAWLPYS